MKKNTLKKLVAIKKKELDELLVERFNLLSGMKSLEVKLVRLKEELTSELESFSSLSLNRFDLGLFINKELMKQREVEGEIETRRVELNNLIKTIVEKDIEKKTHEKLLDDFEARERLEEEKNELKIIDAFAIFNRKNDKED